MDISFQKCAQCFKKLTNTQTIENNVFVNGIFKRSLRCICDMSSLKRKHLYYILHTDRELRTDFITILVHVCFFSLRKTDDLLSTDLNI